MTINLPHVHAELSAVFQQYEQALVTNDVAVLDALFWNNANTVRFGVGENLYGFAQIQAFRASRPATGLARTLHNTVITTYGETYGTAMTEFMREGSNKVGRQSQTWVKFSDGWKVVAAHVSLMMG
jgi:Protein of unknown function (DUF3225)